MRGEGGIKENKTKNKKSWLHHQKKNFSPWKQSVTSPLENIWFLVSYLQLLMTYDLFDVPVLADPVERAANPEEPRLSHRVDAVGSTASHS